MFSTFIILLLVPVVFLAPPPFAVYSLGQDPTSYKSMVSIYSGNLSNGDLTLVRQVPTYGYGSKTYGLQSQNGLIVHQNYLFGVNPGSNTVFMFSISPTDPTNIDFVEITNSDGDWPLSVTAWKDTLCVVNGGARNGITCFKITPSGLVSPSSISLKLNLTTPPPDHVGPAQISFTTNGAALVISAKQLNPPVMLFPINNGVPSAGVSSISHGAVSFGFAFDSDGTILLTDANPYGNGSGLILLTPSADSITFVTPNYFLIPGEMAACWVVRSSMTKNFYVTNAGSSTVSEISRSGSTLSLVKNYVIPHSNPSDMTIATFGGLDWLYVVEGTAITTYKLISAGNVAIMGSVAATSVSIASYVPL